MLDCHLRRDCRAQIRDQDRASCQHCSPVTTPFQCLLCPYKYHNCTIRKVEFSEPSSLTQELRNSWLRGPLPPSTWMWRFGKQTPNSKTILLKQLVLSFSVPHPQTGQGGTGIIQYVPRDVGSGVTSTQVCKPVLPQTGWVILVKSVTVPEPQWQSDEHWHHQAVLEIKIIIGMIYLEWCLPMANSCWFYLY